MSMVARIETLSIDDLGDANSGFDQGAQKIFRGIMGTINETTTNEQICVEGIVQNEISITATNNWSSTLFYGLTDAFEGVSASPSAAGFSAGSVKGSTILKLAKTVTGSLGYNLAGTGPASKKIYQGSSLSGFNVILKWYTPKSTNWQSHLLNLTNLAWPNGISFSSDSSIDPNTKPTVPSKSTDGKDNMVGSVLSGLGDIIGGIGTNLISKNPEKVKLTIFYGPSEKGVKMYFLTPLIITSFTLTGSRETFNGVPLIVTANISFDYYQVNPTGTLKNNVNQIFGGAIIFEKPKIKAQSTKNVQNNKDNPGLHYISGGLL